MQFTNMQLETIRLKQVWPWFFYFHFCLEMLIKNKKQTLLLHTQETSFLCFLAITQKQVEIKNMKHNLY